MPHLRITMPWDEELAHLVRAAATVLGEDVFDEAVARAIHSVTHQGGEADRRPGGTAPAVSQDLLYEALRAELVRMLRPQ